MDTGLDILDGGGMAFLFSSIALRAMDSTGSRVSSDAGLELFNWTSSSSSSLIPSSSFSSLDTLRANCGSRLLLFAFFEASPSDVTVERFGRFVMGPYMASVDVLCAQNRCRVYLNHGNRSTPARNSRLTSR